MAVTYDSFVERFPELLGAGPPLINAELKAAATQCNPDVWDSHLDDGIAFLAAHRIATRQRAQFARLISKDGSTLFLKEYQRMQGQLVCGDRVP